MKLFRCSCGSYARETALEVTGTGVTTRVARTYSCPRCGMVYRTAEQVIALSHQARGDQETPRGR